MVGFVGHTAATGSPAPFVGRERERAALRERLSAALAGYGAFVLISGEAGIGKTSLVEHVCAEVLARREAMVLVGRFYGLAETPRYGPWAEVLARAPRDLTLPPLPVALGGAGPSEGTESPAVLFRQTRDYLLAQAVRCPIVLVLEDFHWADQPSLDLLRTVGRELAVTPLLTLVTYRADEVAHVEVTLFELRDRQLYVNDPTRSRPDSRYKASLKSFPNGFDCQLARVCLGGDYATLQPLRLAARRGEPDTGAG